MSNKKPSKPKQPPTSRDLVPVGVRQVQIKYRGKRDENGRKPSTSRALILRNGKYGARGTGEVMLVGRITGREKLDLLAEDLVSQKLAHGALMAPLDLGKCLRIADSQYNAYLDDIASLKDPDTFYYKIVSELIARMPRNTHASGCQYSLRNASHVASVISTRIHNTYMIASGWKLVTNTLVELQNSGLKDPTARAQLQTNDDLRSRYLALCDMIGVLVDLGQAQFSVLAMTSPHYARYFKEVENVQPGEPSISFDWASLKDACKSFLDSIIVELCFPRAPYPKRILYQILHDAVNETPGEAKRFPQSMWDAAGDLSVSLELQELLESPLFGLQGDKLRSLPRQMPEQYERWLDAQIYSNRASESCANFKDLISPLERTKNPSVLDDMWKLIELNYKVASGMSLDSLWQLDNAHRRVPQWTSIYMPGLRTYDSDSDSEQRLMPLLKGGGKKRTEGKKKTKKLLAITDGPVDHDHDSMPELQSCSDASDDDEEDSESDGDDGSGDGDGYDDESNYDSEEEEVYRGMVREAMDTAMAIPEFFDPKSSVAEFDALVEERKGNPFLKLLGSLRGRMFSPNPKLSSTTRTEPRNDLLGQQHPSNQTAATAASALETKISYVSTSKTIPTQPTPSKERPSAFVPEEPKNQDCRPTVEDAEDEEDISIVAKKKKKKKPKKKKKNKEETNELSTVHEFVQAPSTPTENLSSSKVFGTPAKPPSDGSLIPNTSLDSRARMSTSSLPVETTQAQSAHSYLQELGAPKEKVKSRPDHASLFSNKKGFLSKLSSKDRTKQDSDCDPIINKKFTWFTKLGKRTAGYMRQLLHTSADEKVGSLKWDNFVKVMRDMGFKYDPSTAGSSVRFDPPNPNDRSITFHKPHPDPTLHANSLRVFGKKLKEYYGWSEDDFLRRTSTV